MKTAVISAAAVVAAVFALNTIAADPPAAAPQGPQVHVLADEPVSGNDKLHAVVALVDWPVGGVSIRHYHAGDEYAIVLDGKVEIDNEGEAPHIYTAGQSYHNKRGVIHIARNANDGPSKLSVVLIIDKGSKLQVPAPAK